jgi:hypothetical protein
METGSVSGIGQGSMGNAIELQTQHLDAWLVPVRRSDLI